MFSFIVLSIDRISAKSVSNYYNDAYRQFDHLFRGKQEFPLHPFYDDAGVGFVECGTRTIPFELRRTGKIVGGAESPYGAFPWQVLFL